MSWTKPEPLVSSGDSYEAGLKDASNRIVSWLEDYFQEIDPQHCNDCWAMQVIIDRAKNQSW